MAIRFRNAFIACLNFHIVFKKDTTATGHIGYHTFWPSCFLSTIQQDPDVVFIIFPAKISSLILINPAD